MKLKIVQAMYIEDYSTLETSMDYRIEPITLKGITFDYIYVLDTNGYLDFNLNSKHCEHVWYMEELPDDITSEDITEQLQILDLPPLTEWAMRQLEDELWDGTQPVNTRKKW